MASEPSMRNTSTHPQPRRVLVIEDSPFLARGLTVLLQREGLAVETVADYETALSQAQREPFDLILCDIVLPDGNGWHLVERVAKSIPTIALTAFGDDAKLCSQTAGFTAHFQKPFDVETFLQTVRRLTGSGTPR